jgi:glycosyltransferase involved in cell wall biosynthesis
VASLAPSRGGPSKSVVALADALARTGHASTRLLYQSSPNEEAVPSSADVDRIAVLGKSVLGDAGGLPVRARLEQIGASARPDVVHSHGLWQPANHWVSSSARRWRVPLIIHPRGMLEPWALSQKATKKRVALATFQGRDLRAARAFVASSEVEWRNLRRFGIGQPVAVIPNGVELPASREVAPAPRPRDEMRSALFMSRVHPQKGVLELVRAWARTRPAGWRLEIAGPDEDWHWDEVAKVVGQLGLADVVTYHGAVEGERKRQLWRRADLFVLPTFTESFGMAVAEALASGVPVITTRGAPWSDLETHHCGWWIDVGVEPLAAALRQATELTDVERRAMGERGRQYVRRFDWDEIAGQTLALYRWLLGRGDRPACVKLD